MPWPAPLAYSIYASFSRHQIVTRRRATIDHRLKTDCRLELNGIVWDLWAPSRVKMLERRIDRAS
jgi:hypothetical protein